MAADFPVVDIFSGIGCASFGFKKAGFKIAAALEINPLRCEVYEKNLGVRPIQADVMEVDGKKILSVAKLKKGASF